jgi:hypothetical protein
MLKGQLRPLVVRTTSLKGIATFRLYGRPAAWSNVRTRLMLAAQATRKGQPAIASTKRIVRLTVVQPR